MTRRVLFVCEGNLHRSPTAQRLYAQTQGIEARSAGLSPLARVQLTDELIEWSDVVIVMERRLVKMVKRRFGGALGDRDVIDLNVPDDYQFMQAELLAVLRERLEPLLGPPG
jgi:predicted protein tyrosine phosphatase